MDHRTWASLGCNWKYTSGTKGEILEIHIYMKAITDKVVAGIISSPCSPLY